VVDTIRCADMETSTPGRTARHATRALTKWCSRLAGGQARVVTSPRDVWLMVDETSD